MSSQVPGYQMEGIMNGMKQILAIGPAKKLFIMMCGIAGSGKTTLSKAIMSLNPMIWTRLSIDEIIAEKHGLYNKDYRESEFEAYQTEAELEFRRRLDAWLADSLIGHGLILDRSFCSRKDRDEFRKIIEQGDAESRLVYLEAEKEVLWQRICDRGDIIKDANSALDISRDLFEAYVASFDRPANEQEHKISAV
ncbi:Putative P-loop containing nucleoside triphosphate hydrolase [Septoria linicola]|uniref:P-loop containing nucleoside triphosphate hydrolase n=1 Tax=Septoria linicola TaxID=215465 RepID=A0A9Q9EKB9_9PEZI|nr:putative P-loop containing nucleoside triphosphate hydrolase [Septoria linicola]USW54646.1 Putative P-loop containing nucleoside triphosphate hydrolase [Septoria linicola]